MAAKIGHRRRSRVEIGVDEVAPVLSVELRGETVEPTRSQNMTVIGRRRPMPEGAWMEQTSSGKGTPEATSAGYYGDRVE